MRRIASVRKFAGALLLSLACSPAFACGCAMPIDLSRFEEIARAFESADDVYSAAVEDVLPHDEPGDTSRTNLQWAQLRVLQVWKGSYRPGQQLQIFTRHHPLLLNCAMEPAAGEALMIYGEGNGSYAGFSTCSRTGPLSRAFPDWPVLRQLARRNAADRLIQPPDGSGNRPPWLSDVLVEVYVSESVARGRARQ